MNLKTLKVMMEKCEWMLQIPLLIICVFLLIGFMGFIITTSIEFLFSVVGIGISIAVLLVSMQQSRIQKDNIKIQLFDKRYKVYQSVLDTITIVRRNNWDRYIFLNKECNINEQIIQIEEELYKSVQLSTCLFSKDVCDKLILLNNSFCEVVRSYKNLLLNNSLLITSEKDYQEFMGLFVEYLYSEKGLNNDDIGKAINVRFPKIYATLLAFSEECDNYLSLVEESNILLDLEKYVIVDKLEQ